MYNYCEESKMAKVQSTEQKRPKTCRIQKTSEIIQLLKPGTTDKPEFKKLKDKLQKLLALFTSVRLRIFYRDCKADKAYA